MKIAFLVRVDICEDFETQTMSNSAADFGLVYFVWGVWDNVPMITLVLTSVMTIGQLVDTRQGF